MSKIDILAITNVSHNANTSSLHLQQTSSNFHNFYSNAYLMKCAILRQTSDFSVEHDRCLQHQTKQHVLLFILSEQLDLGVPLFKEIRRNGLSISITNNWTYEVLKKIYYCSLSIFNEWSNKMYQRKKFIEKIFFERKTFFKFISNICFNKVLLNQFSSFNSFISLTVIIKSFNGNKLNAENNSLLVLIYSYSFFEHSRNIPLRFVTCLCFLLFCLVIFIHRRITIVFAFPGSHWNPEFS